MKENWLQRTQLMFGNDAIQRIQQSHVAIFGVGGVGGYVAEALARSGVGAIDLIDPDRVSLTNLNRQIVALHSTIGQLKVDVMRQRILDINPACRVTTYPLFYLPDNADSIDLSCYDYVADCIDTVRAKLELIRRCQRLSTPILCSMGAGNRLNPMAFRVMDIANTQGDPLARAIRTTLRHEGIRHQPVVCSTELPVTTSSLQPGEKRPTPASNAFVPAAAGLTIAAAILEALSKSPVPTTTRDCP